VTTSYLLDIHSATPLVSLLCARNGHSGISDGV
jgi:hypothetical protein